ncbi:hypothetical protein BDN72DRAFT_859540 [Pluteus cervinus]|uniref:Uncharacterized protein n=1 Tax=Pluteus cervinus TaxID=181527 RepID=A0ACD3AN93_9AGAR|nr:hypothetical protein BDN72DRAFT_859540 [Pluteus cervinus]
MNPVGTLDAEVHMNVMKRFFSRIKSGGLHKKSEKFEFLNLPTEIILKILQTPNIDLRTLAKVSRFMNTLTIFHVLSLHGIHNPSASLTIKIAGREVGYDEKGKRDLLAFLSIAFGIRTTKTLTIQFVFPFIPNPLFIRHLCLQYTRFSTFLRRLEKVHTIVLNLEEHNIFQLGRAGVDVEVSNAWTIVTTSLLNTCITNGCEVLEIWNGGYPDSDYRVRVFNPGNIHVTKRNQQAKSYAPAPQFLMVTTPTIIGYDWEVECIRPAVRPHVGSSLSVSARGRIGNLQSLRISSEMLLYPPHSNWLYQLLAAPSTSLGPETTSSSLTTLVLEGVHGLSPEWWHATLSWLVGPLQSTLQNLTIGGCSGLPKEPLRRFLEGLRGLSTLELWDPLPVLDDITKGVDGAQLKLSDGLTSIRAPSDYIWLLLLAGNNRGDQSENWETAYPSLSALDVVPRCLEDGKHHNSGEDKNGDTGGTHSEPLPISALLETLQPILAILSQSPSPSTDIKVVLDFRVTNFKMQSPAVSNSNSSSDHLWSKVREVILPDNLFITPTTTSSDGEQQGQSRKMAWMDCFCVLRGVRKVTLAKNRNQSGSRAKYGEIRQETVWNGDMVRHAVDCAKRVWPELESVQFESGLLGSEDEVHVFEVVDNRCNDL